MDICKLCGAVGHGNITCPECKNNMKFLTEETKMAFKNCKITPPLGTKKDSPYLKNIQKYNKSNKK